MNFYFLFSISEEKYEPYRNGVKEVLAKIGQSQHLLHEWENVNSKRKHKLKSQFEYYLFCFCLFYLKHFFQKLEDKEDLELKENIEKITDITFTGCSPVYNLQNLLKF